MEACREDWRHSFRRLWVLRVEPMPSPLLEPAALRGVAVQFAVASGGQVVGIAGQGHQRYRLTGLDRSPCFSFDDELRRDVVPKLVAQTAAVPSNFGRNHLFVDLVIALERCIGFLGSAVGVRVQISSLLPKSRGK